MKRAGFTMIELIFVIVILGILAAVALPKFAGVSDSAQVSKLSAFVGTLNRSAGPAMWNQTMTDATVVANKGEMDTLLALNNPDTGATFVVADFVDIPSEVVAVGFVVDSATCVAVGTPVPAVGSAVTTVGAATTAPVVIGGTSYNIGCVDGDNTESPKFWLDDGTNIIAG